MVMRVGGLASGMDIDALVEKLMNAERAPLNKLTQKKQTYEWQRDAYRGVNTKLKTFDTYIADNLVLKSLNSKTASTSNSNLVSATATGSATGSLSIEGVSQLATSARAVGNQVSAAGSTKMSDLIGGGTKTIELKAIKADGTMPSEATKIEITDGMTVNQFVSKVNASNAGVSAVFENGRFSFTAKNSGDNKAGEEIEVMSGKDIFTSLGFFQQKDELGNVIDKFQTTAGKNAIFQVNGIATERSSNTFSLSGYNVTLKETFNTTQTIADKYKSAQKEMQLATENEANKAVALANALSAYYGNGTSDTPNYTSTHNNIYNAAFGNTLSLTEQAEYRKLTTSDWKNLTAEEFETIKLASSNSKEDVIAVIDASSLSDESKTKLKALSAEKMSTVYNTSENEFSHFKVQADYVSYGGSKLKDLSGDAITALKGLTIDETTELSAIRTSIDENGYFSDELKSALKSLDKETLTSLQNLDATTLNEYAEKAQSDELKSNYSKLGDAKILEVFADPSKVSSLTDEQQAIWNGLSGTEQTAFKNLADQNQLRSAYNTAKAEDVAADERLANAENSLNTAKADAQNEGVLNGDGTVKDDLVNAAPSAQSVSLSSTTNVDEMMNKIKEFVTTYNGLIKDLNDQTKETKYRDYAPLTAEQKNDMEESEIKLWEEKAKSGLLRNDSLVRNGLSNMRSLIYQSNPGLEGSKYNTLFNVGITTSKSYNDGGTLEIDEAKLRKAIEEDPDAVERLFKNSGGQKSDPAYGGSDTRGYLEKLRESMKSLEVNIDKKAGRSTMTDAQYAIGKSLIDNEKRIDTWQSKLKNIEARYWKQFTAMETAINKANQQSSMFMQG
ncbi:flagellar filament capping protein FliD [Solibacillus sp. FSL R5-0449]|uniref:flagellar filament capping protein FliD n=1 Tax=Solibacillus sp. FSL R5-0449 TaxID=2921639 RepID=UPI0030CCCE95